MNDILPIILPILVALVVLAALIPVLMKTRKNITNYPSQRDANEPERVQDVNETAWPFGGIF